MGKKLSCVLAPAACIETLGIATGITGGVITGIKQSKLENEVFATLRVDEASRLTSEYNVAKSDLDIITEKFLAGEISENELLLERADYKDIEENFKKDLEKLESKDYLEELMELKASQDAGILKKRDEIATLGKIRAACIALGCVGAFTLACTTILGASI